MLSHSSLLNSPTVCFCSPAQCAQADDASCRSEGGQAKCSSRAYPVQLFAKVCIMSGIKGHLVQLQLHALQHACRHAFFLHIHVICCSADPGLRQARSKCTTVPQCVSRLKQQHDSITARPLQGHPLHRNARVQQNYRHLNLQRTGLRWRAYVCRCKRLCKVACLFALV